MRKRLLHLTRILVLLFIGLILLTVGLSWLENRNFRETFYQIPTLKVESHIRIIQLSDLHSTEYGTGNEHLISRIEQLEPDLIVLTGDCIDETDTDESVVLHLVSRLEPIAPVYYIYGNAETARQYGLTMTKQSLDERFGFGEDSPRDVDFTHLEDPFRDKLEAAGAQVLLNTQASIEVGETVIDIYGTLTSNPSAFWPYAETTFGNFLYTDRSHFKLMLVHEPYLMEVLRDENWGDLILCGHTHGGMARIPYLGGAYEQKNGLLPEWRGQGYILGRYNADGTPLIVSSGLSNRDLLRINNQPELVIVDLTRY